MEPNTEPSPNSDSDWEKKWPKQSVLLHRKVFPPLKWNSYKGERQFKRRPAGQRLRSRRCAKIRLPCLENPGLFGGEAFFLLLFVRSLGCFFFTRYLKLTEILLRSKNLQCAKSRRSESVSLHYKARCVSIVFYRLCFVCLQKTHLRSPL